MKIKNLFKKLSVAILLGAGVLSLASCGDKTGDGGDDSSSDTPPANTHVVTDYAYKELFEGTVSAGIAVTTGTGFQGYKGGDYKNTEVPNGEDFIIDQMTSSTGFTADTFSVLRFNVKKGYIIESISYDFKCNNRDAWMRTSAGNRCFGLSVVESNNSFRHKKGKVYSVNLDMTKSAKNDYKNKDKVDITYGDFSFGTMYLDITFNTADMIDGIRTSDILEIDDLGKYSWTISNFKVVYKKT